MFIAPQTTGTQVVVVASDDGPALVVVPLDQSPAVVVVEREQGLPGPPGPPGTGGGLLPGLYADPDIIIDGGLL